MPLEFKMLDIFSKSIISWECPIIWWWGATPLSANFGHKSDQWHCSQSQLETNRGTAKNRHWGIKLLSVGRFHECLCESDETHVTTTSKTFSKPWLLRDDKLNIYKKGNFCSNLDKATSLIIELVLNLLLFMNILFEYLLFLVFVKLNQYICKYRDNNAVY